MRFHVHREDAGKESPASVPSVSPAPIPVPIGTLHAVSHVHPHAQPHPPHPHPPLPAHLPPAIGIPPTQELYEYEDDEPEPPLTFSERFHESVAENRTVINTFCAGGLAGAASRTAVAPLERLKIIL
jgi:hypothetical protein